MRTYISILVLFLLSNICYGQVNHKKAYQLTLENDEVGKAISFDQTKGEDYDSLVLVYLGDIKTKKGQHLKILTSRWYWGISKRGTSRVVVFNQKNQYLGDYYLTMTYEVPDKIEGTSLVFTNKKGSDCSPNVVTKVSFQNGIPKSFFLRCNGQYGDIYSFAKNL